MSKSTDNDSERLEELNAGLFFAIDKNYLELAEVLIENGADVNSFDGFGRHLLYHSSNQDGCRVECGRFLINQGVDVNLVNSIGDTVLHSAVRWMDRSLVEFLIGNGADINIVTTKLGAGRTPLGLAVIASNVEIAKTLINAGADVNEGVDSTPLDIAIAKEDYYMQELLRSKGAKTTRAKKMAEKRKEH